MIRYLVVYTAVVRFSIAGLCMFCSFALITLSFARAYVSLPRINIVWSQSLYLVSLHDEKRGTDTKRAGYRMCRRNGLTSDSFVCRFFLLTLSSFVDRLSLAKYRTKDNEAPFLFAFPVFFHPPPSPPPFRSLTSSSKKSTRTPSTPPSPAARSSSTAELLRAAGASPSESSSSRRKLCPRNLVRIQLR